MNLKIVSASSPSFRQVADITEPNKRAYAEKHGFQCVFPVYENPDDHGYGRINIIQDNLTDCDWLLWMGADTIFTDFGTDARIFLRDHYDLICAFDNHGLQSDVMFIRNCQAIRNLLYAVLFRKEKDQDKPEFMAACEQGSMVCVLAGLEEYQDALPCSALNVSPVRVLEADKTINRYENDYRPGDFIYHTPGMPIEDKVRLLKAKAESILQSA